MFVGNRISYQRCDFLQALIIESDILQVEETKEGAYDDESIRSGTNQ
jgi:hypothetical protein